MEVLDLEWNAAASTLSLTYDAAPGSSKAPFEHQLDFRVPEGWTLQDAQVDGAASGTVATELNGNILSLTFSMDERKDVVIDLVFE